MTTSINEIMKHLDPRIILEKTLIPHDTARCKFQLASSIVGSSKEFENVLIQYMDHHLKEVYSHSEAPHILLAKARNYMEQAKIKYEEAQYSALFGSNGGLNNVLNQICAGIQQEERMAYFTYVMNTFIDSLNFSQKVDLMREMKSKLAAFSSPSAQYLEPEAMAHEYREVIFQYIEQLMQYKHLWRY